MKYPDLNISAWKKKNLVATKKATWLDIYTSGRITSLLFRVVLGWRALPRWMWIQFTCKFWIWSGFGGQANQWEPGDLCHFWIGNQSIKSGVLWRLEMWHDYIMCEMYFRCDSGYSLSSTWIRLESVLRWNKRASSPSIASSSSLWVFLPWRMVKLF